MQDPQQLQQALKNNKLFEKYLARGEIKELPTILWEDEEPLDIIQGFYGKGNGLLVSTNKRLVFIDKGLMSLRVEDFPYDKITSIQYKTGFIYGEIDIFASGNKAEIKNILKDRVKPFAESVRNRISVGNNALTTNSNKQQEDKYSKLERLHGLMEKGILSKEEFEKEKKHILQ